MASRSISMADVSNAITAASKAAQNAGNYYGNQAVGGWTQGGQGNLQGFWDHSMLGDPFRLAHQWRQIADGPPIVPVEKAEEPVAVAVAESGADQEYLDLAVRLGVNGPAVAKARLLNFLHTEAMGVYNNQRVDSYMRQIAAGRIWCWKPLRRQDREALCTISTPLNKKQPNYHGEAVLEIYPHAVPFVALLSAERIAKAFPDALLLVTDFEAPKPDPFMSVTTRELFDRDQTVLIFERWSEPKYRD